MEFNLYLIIKAKRFLVGPFFVTPNFCRNYKHCHRLVNKTVRTISLLHRGTVASHSSDEICIPCPDPISCPSTLRPLSPPALSAACGSGKRRPGGWPRIGVLVTTSTRREPGYLEGRPPATWMTRDTEAIPCRDTGGASRRSNLGAVEAASKCAYKASPARPGGGGPSPRSGLTFSGGRCCWCSKSDLGGCSCSCTRMALSVDLGRDLACVRR
jgi:hypothetical protein